MLTQSLSTTVIGNKAVPAAHSPSDQFCALTGHAVWWSQNLPTRRRRRSTAKMSRRNMSTR